MLSGFAYILSNQSHENELAFILIYSCFFFFFLVIFTVVK